ncbi:uncharacterized protein I206_107043 [Kwoniella pini CBS 10737]|uniref:Small secreted protein n=1 Tax=Kwoniella pini CBS 10737 TaxID=1296096 RepID=A0A1B9HZE7_9TREE|nr:uncharacterized protein I206_05414 [Kwoniella pini CBS 10737]OCF48634.1 hypothetical protein I206_05414 [Kwoniella pini CBS 10737]
MIHKYFVIILPLLILINANPIKRQGIICPSFQLEDYSNFQISNGIGGNAKSEANSIFVNPFNDCDLSTVDKISLSNIQIMREAAENAEVNLFKPQINDSIGDLSNSLQVGKIKNKVLKLTGEIQALKIQAAQGEDNADKIVEEQIKLDKNIATDVASAGEASTAAV